MKDQAPPNTDFTAIVLRSIDSGSGRRALSFDAARYEAMVHELDLDEDAKHDLLGEMWNVIVAFVDLGFEIKMQDDPPETCGQSDMMPDGAGEAVLDCSDIQTINESFAAATYADGLDSKQKEVV